MPHLNRAPRRLLRVLLLVSILPVIINSQTTNSSDSDDTTLGRQGGSGEFTNIHAGEAGPASQGEIMGEAGKPEMRGAIALNNLAVERAREKRFIEARSHLERAVKLDGTLAGLHINLSSVYESLGLPREALKSARRAVELDPKNARARTQLCELEIVNLNFAGAVDCFKAFPTFQHLDSMSLSNYGLALMRVGRIDEAVRTFEKSVALTPLNASAYNGLGYVKYRKKDYEAAVKALKRAVELDPSRADARFNLAMAQLANRNKAGAISQYKFLRESNPELAQKIYRWIFRDKVVFI